MFKLKDPRPTFMDRSIPAGPVARDRVDEIAVVGQVFRGGVRQLTFFDGKLWILAGRGAQILDPRTLEVEAWVEPERSFERLIPCGDRLFAYLDEAIWALDAAAGRLGARLCAAPERLEDVVGCPTFIAWPNDDGATLVDLTTGASRALRARAELLGEDPWRKTPNRVCVSPSGAFIGAFKRGEALTVWRAASGEIVHERAYSVEGALLLDDERVIISSRDEHQRFAFGAEDHDGALRGEGRLLRAGADAAIIDRFGGHTPVKLEAFEARAYVAAQPSHYGAMSQLCGAASAEGVAVYAGSYGTLHVTTDAPRVSTGWVSRPEGFSVARDGRRLVMETSWHDEALFVDLEAGVERAFSGRGGMDGPGISDDGATLIAPLGNNLGPRTVWTCPAYGEEAEATEGFKIAPWSRRIEGLSPDLFMVATYRLSGAGYVGLYREGQSRALLKLKHAKKSPWDFCVNREGTRCWVDWSEAVTLHDLTRRGRELEREEARLSALTMGSGERRACINYRHGGEHKGPMLCIRDGQVTRSVPIEPSKGFGGIKLIFSEEDDLLFLAHPDGILEIRAGDTGALLRALPLHAGGVKALMRRAGLIFSLGEDGVIYLLGVPGAPPLEVKAPAPEEAPEIEPEPVVELPRTQPWRAPGVPEVFDLGPREITILTDKEGPRLVDDAGAAVKSLRKRKADDPAAFEALKARWKALRGGVDVDAAWGALIDNALVDGRSATVGELAAARILPGGMKHLAKTTWVEARSGVALRWTRGRLTRQDGGALEDNVRVRLAHPARDDVALRGAQARRPTHTPSDPESHEVCPVSTDWAKTQNATIGRILVSRGFVKVDDSGRGTCAWHLPAPELGAVAVVSLDEEHGGSTLSFYAWSGFIDGGAALRFGAVDPQLYAEAYQAVIDAYPYDA